MLFIDEVALADSDRVVSFRAELAIVNVQSDTCPPVGARTHSAPACWPLLSGRRRWHGRHDAPHSLSARPLSSFLSLALRLAEMSLPLPPRALRAPRDLASASCFASERLQVRLKLLHLLHPSVGQDLPEVSDISRVPRCRVHGHRDPDSGEPRCCSILASFLPSKLR